MPPLPLENSVVVVDSETEPESELESQPDRSSYVENQLGLPQYQYGVYCSSPPAVNADINTDDLNNVNNTNVNERNDANKENDANEPRATNTEILLSLGDKKKTEIKVQVEDTYRSTVEIHIEQANFRGEKHEREFEGVEETKIHVQVKRIRK